MTSGIHGLAHKHTLTVTTGMTCLFSAQRPSFCHFFPLLCHSCQFLVLLTFTIFASSPHVLLLCFLVIGCMYSEAECEEVPVFGLSDAVKCDFCQRGGSSKWKKRDLWKHNLKSRPVRRALTGRHTSTHAGWESRLKVSFIGSDTLPM